MQKIFVLSIVFLLTVKYSTCQDSLYLRDYHSLSRTTKGIALRTGIGLQKAFYGELGISRYSTTFGCTGYGSSDWYASMEWAIPGHGNRVFGWKAGCELNVMLLSLGLEAKFQSDFRQNDVVVTPKVGLGFNTAIQLFYGYNISFNKYPFEDINRSQFSLVVNISLKKIKK